MIVYSRTVLTFRAVYKDKKWVFSSLSAWHWCLVVVCRSCVYQWTSVSANHFYRYQIGILTRCFIGLIPRYCSAVWPQFIAVHFGFFHSVHAEASFSTNQIAQNGVNFCHSYVIGSKPSVNLYVQQSQFQSVTNALQWIDHLKKLHTNMFHVVCSGDVSPPGIISIPQIMREYNLGIRKTGIQ